VIDSVAKMFSFWIKSCCSMHCCCSVLLTKLYIEAILCAFLRVVLQPPGVCVIVLGVRRTAVADCLGIFNCSVYFVCVYSLNIV